jgi:chloride channel protein, CIC family
MIVFAFEITRDYNAILPLMLGCVMAQGVASLYMPNSIMTEKLARRGLRLSQDYEADVLQRIDVREVMETQPHRVPGTMTVGELASRMARGDSDLGPHRAFPILDDDHHLVGIVTWGDIARAVADTTAGERTVLAAGTRPAIVAYPDESVQDAVLTMLEHDVGQLPVVDRRDPLTLIGYLGRSAILEAYRRRLHEERIREPGWLQRGG